MAIDTRDKRSGALLVYVPWRGLLPLADGAIGQADRQQVALAYPGILATDIAVAQSGPFTLTISDVGMYTLTASDAAAHSVTISDAGGYTVTVSDN